MPYTSNVILESARDNNGARTVFKTVLPAYTDALPHYHTLFTETFEVVEGEIDIWNGFGKVHLEKGQSVSIERNTIHHYVVGKMETTLLMTIEPGNLNFELALGVIQGMLNDGSYLGFTQKHELSFASIINALSDSNPVNENRERIERFLHSEEGQQVKVLSKELIDKYCGQ